MFITFILSTVTTEVSFILFNLSIVTRHNSIAIVVVFFKT